MNNVEILVRYDCTSCKGKKKHQNPEFDENTDSDQERFNECIHCNGTGKMEKHISMIELLVMINETVDMSGVNHA